MGKFTGSNINPSNVICFFNTVPSHTLQLYLQKPTYMPTLLLSHLWPNSVPTYILFSKHIPRITNSFTFSLSYLTPNVQIVSFLTYTRKFTHTLARFSTIGLTQVSNSTLTQISWYRPFLVNNLYVINICVTITSRASVLHDFYISDSSVVIQPGKYIQELWIHSVHSLDQFPALFDSLPIIVPSARRNLLPGQLV